MVWGCACGVGGGGAALEAIMADFTARNEKGKLKALYLYISQKFYKIELNRVDLELAKQG